MTAYVQWSTERLRVDLPFGYSYSDVDAGLESLHSLAGGRHPGYALTMVKGCEISETIDYKGYKIRHVKVSEAGRGYIKLVSGQTVQHEGTLDVDVTS